MDQKMIKNALKEARDAIKNKNHAIAMKLSKNILKSDKENYMALVFLGISLQEVGPKEQAPLAFKKAILISPNQALAWNGLATFYEKDDSDLASKELISIYEKLLQLETEVSKIGDLCSKLVLRALQISETEKTALILSKLVTDNEQLSENIKRCVWTNIFTLLTSQDINNLPLDLQTLFEQTLASLVSDRTTVCSNYYKEYLKLLYKLQKYDTVFSEAVKMQNLYETTVYPLEWIAKIYVELSIEENELANNYQNDIDKYCIKMLALQEDSVMAIFAQGVKKYRLKNVVESKEDLEKVVNLKANLVYAWVLLSEVLLIFKNNEEALNCVEKAENLFKNLKKPSVVLKNKIDGILLHTLAHQTNPDKLKKCLEIGNQLAEENPEDTKTFVSIATAQINLKNYDIAENLLNKMSQNSSDFFLLKLKLLRYQGHLEQALNLIEDITEKSSECHLEIGLIHWSLSNYELSLISYLKSAKLNPNNYQCFANLGKCYEVLKNDEKAKRCYQKAFKLNPKCMEAGIGLSNIYRNQKNWEANFKLLQSVTQFNATIQLSIPRANQWAVLQLGLNYFEQQDYTKSIDCLRNLIRSEPENGHYWECLGDAYMARGSYKTALNSFKQAIELKENVLYPKLQFATIKLLLGLHDEATEVFESILNENKYYIPALKGLAENYLNQAISQRKEQFLGRARENAQLSINYLTTALKERSDLSCLWKLMGDVCLLSADLPVSYCYLTVDSILVEDDAPVLNKNKLYILSARCYCKAISLTQLNILLWHDLAVCYYKHGCHLITTDPSDGKMLIERAFEISKFCVRQNDRNRQHWNLLGVISMHKNFENYALAQHALVKAVTLDRNSAVAWTNLGTLYLKLNHSNLANAAFSQAQRGDPNYINCWIGQALVAETMNHEDAMDLFRHSTQLSHHPQSAIGYANWVCKTILDSESHVKLYSIHNMHAIPVAVDALTWYTENNPNDACAWNMLGLLRERLGLKTSTLKAFEMAQALVADDQNRDKVLINCARSCVSLQQYKRGIDLYKQVKNASFNHGCGMALALFKEEEYKESYESYDATMNFLTEDQTLQSHILVALAAITYLFNEVEDAKILLFRSTQLKPPSNWGLFATLAHGLLHKDLNLAELVLKELQPLKDNIVIVYHYSVLLCLTHLRQGDKKSAIRSLIKSVHRHPGNAQLWQFLSILLLTLDAENKSKYAANFAEVSMTLGISEMDVTKVLGIASLACCISKDSKKALTLAQKAVHSYPNLAENWSVLLTVLSYQKIDNWASQHDFIQTRALHVKNNMNPSEELLQWFTEIVI